MKKDKIWIWEFSKRILRAEAVCFFLEQIAFLLLVAFERTPPDVLVQTSADVFTASVVAYCIKSGFENVMKIKKKEKDDGDCI